MTANLTDAGGGTGVTRPLSPPAMAAPTAAPNLNPLLLRAQRTLAILDVLERLDHERRVPRPSEIAELASWPGWGALAPAYGRRGAGNPRWAEVRAAVERRVSPSQRAALASGINSSYFTDPRLVRAMWRLATGLGFTGGEVLDIGCGTGAFIAASPPSTPGRCTGVEPDPMAARIAALRFPSAEIIGRELQDVMLADASFDLAIGNVPFADPDTADYARTNGFSLHNYCLWRALHAVRPGGLVVAITSRFTLDATSPIQRRGLAALGDLIGAIRLPCGAFGTAGSSVVTDLVAFRRHSPHTARVRDGWRRVVDGIVPGILINEYFADEPT